MILKQSNVHPTLLLGYDVESRGTGGFGFEEAARFLKVAVPLHKELQVPCTLFICGMTLENNIKEFQKVGAEHADLFDLQQHTYSHVLLKTVVQDNETGITVYSGGDPGKIREEIQKTNGLFKKYLDVNCIGLTGPYGYYRGLSDRLDLLKILHESGIRFSRTFARNEHDWFPVPFSKQPFWYEEQGFGDILEFPVQGWQDCVWRNSHGWDKHEEYFQHIKKGIDYIAEHKLTWNYVQHDWSSLKEDPEMLITRRIITYALERGVRIRSYLDYYKESLAIREGLSK